MDYNENDDPSEKFYNALKTNLKSTSDSEKFEMYYRSNVTADHLQYCIDEVDNFGENSEVCQADIDKTLDYYYEYGGHKIDIRQILDKMRLTNRILLKIILDNRRN